ncbi:hypothetical protein CRYUN_Cryun09bG0060700 [Craigia yunnanensis]
MARASRKQRVLLSQKANRIYPESGLLGQLLKSGRGIDPDGSKPITSSEGKLVVMGGWYTTSYNPVRDVFVYDFTTQRSAYQGAPEGFFLMNEQSVKLGIWGIEAFPLDSLIQVMGTDVLLSLFGFMNHEINVNLKQCIIEGSNR